MAYETTITERRPAPPRAERALPPGSPVGQAFSLIYFVYIVAPIVAGVDKFFHYLVDWNIYVSPAYASIVGGNVPRLMDVAGIVEITAGLVVALKPRAGGVIVAVWLWGIIINLLLI